MISYTDRETEKYHPFGKKVINEALKELNLHKLYEVVHHKRVGTLQSDLAICNKNTGKYLCIIEVKKTPTDVKSIRYQYQAMSYVSMAADNLEKPYYIITNFEDSYVFRYDLSRARVSQQMLEPGLIHIGKFEEFSENEFKEKLKKMFKIQINNFIEDRYKYLEMLEQLKEYLSQIKEDYRKWKSCLAVLFYEYIRGSFSAVGRNSYKFDVRTFNNNIENICREGSKVNFKEIFNYNTENYLESYEVEESLLTKMFNFAKSNISADILTDLIYEIIAENQEQSGKVKTDIELGRILSLMAKYIYGDQKINGFVCDPAAGSGNLISSAIDYLNLDSDKIIVNDKDTYLMEILSLKLGLKYPYSINNINSPKISNKDIIDMNKDDFENIDIILLNPPFIKGIECREIKNSFSQKIKELTGIESRFRSGQYGLEALFIELITALAKDNTVIACIIPKQYLNAIGDEAVGFRKYLLESFGLKVIFNYPRKNLFPNVKKDTFIIVGKKNSKNTNIEVFSSLKNVNEINIDEFKQNLFKERVSKDNFQTIIPGIEFIRLKKEELQNTANEGWRKVDTLIYEAIEFVENNIKSNPQILKIDDLGMVTKRGQIADNVTGISNFIFVNSSKKGFNIIKYNKGKLYPAMKLAKSNKLFVENGNCKFINFNDLDNKEELDSIVKDYIDFSKKKNKKSKQKKKDLNKDNIKKQALKYGKSEKVPINSVLIPRNIRTYGRVYINNKKEIYLSTNFVYVKAPNRKYANIIASWCSTIFYQLACEVLCKDQEGTRKMEHASIRATYVVNPQIINDEKYNELENLLNEIKFVRLQNPIIRDIDRFWAEILYKDKADNVLKDARDLLQYISQKRDSKKK